MKCIRCKEDKPPDAFSFDKSKGKKINTCKLCKSKISKDWYAKNKEHAANVRKTYYKNNKETIKTRSSRHYYKYKDCDWFVEQKKAQTKEWQQKNLAKKAATEGKRRAQKLFATPKWLTAEQKMEIMHMYKNASDLSKQTNTKMHVDHIVPLKGKNVCGLHVPWNLQILLATQNISKGNRI